MKANNIDWFTKNEVYRQGYFNNHLLYELHLHVNEYHDAELYYVGPGLFETDFPEEESRIKILLRCAENHFIEYQEEIEKLLRGFEIYGE